MKYKIILKMGKYSFTKYLVVSFLCYGVQTASVHHANLPGPLVYVVTPSSLKDVPDTAAETPRYYSGHAWPQIATFDQPQQNKIEKKSDLIFAEFEKDDNNNPDSMKKSIKQLLEREKIRPPSLQPEIQDIPQTFSDLKEHMQNEAKKSSAPDVESSQSISTTTSTTAAPMRVEDIWHVINNEKTYSSPASWGGDPANPYDLFDSAKTQETPHDTEPLQYTSSTESFYASFPAHNTNTGENESRAIQSNFGFPYVNLNTIQMKNRNKLQATKVANKNENSQYYNLADIPNEKFPGKGEAVDSPHVYRQAIDRYNPAQPYLPSAKYGPKDSTPAPAPPPLPPPKSSYAAPPNPVSKDFAQPLGNYESFPPYPPSIDSLNPPQVSKYVPPLAPSYDPPPTSSYAVPPPPQAPPMQQPTDNIFDFPPPPDIASNGYSYNRPTPPSDGNTGGYSYSRPAPPPPLAAPSSQPDMEPGFPYFYKKPSYGSLSPTRLPALSLSQSSPDDSDSAGGDVPNAGDNSNSMDGSMTSGGTSMGSYGPQMDDHKPDYPELVFNKHHHSMDADDGSADMRPPPLPAPTFDKPPHHDHHAHLPSDFEPDFKYHDISDYDHYHHHHHPTTTTTTEAPTTEMPRVNNRFSYYYLGKKLYYLPLYFSIYFIAYVGALIIKAVLRHKITYPQHWRERRSLDDTLSHDNLLQLTGVITNHIMAAAERYSGKKQE